MKSYTDIEQSKKLAKFLPLESADGYWFKGFPAQPYMVYTKGTPNPGEHISCWSLSALLELMPLGIYDEDNYSYELKIDMIDKMPRFVRLEDCYHSDFPYDFGKDNLLDNIVESIIWLKENGKI